MGTASSALRSTVLATSDLLLALAGLAVVCYPAISVGNALVGAPLGEAGVRLVVGVLALGGAYPFVAGDLSYGRLRDFLVTFVVASFVVAAIGAVVVAALGLELSGGNPVPRALALGVAYAVAYALVYRGGYARLRGVAGGGS